MVRDNKMSDVLLIKSLTERLKNGKDVSFEEAQFIADLVEEKTFALNPHSKTFDCDLHTAVLEWFIAVANRLPARGNFVCSVGLSKNLNEWLPSDIFFSLERCREKLLFPDGVRKIEYLIPNGPGRKIETVLFERAGDIRRTRFFEELKKMKKLPGNVRCSSYFSFDPKDYIFYIDKKILLYISAVQSARCPLIHVFSACYSGGLPLIYASDLKKHSYVPYIMRRNPDEIVYWAERTGYIDEEMAQWLLWNGSIDSERTDVAGICSGFAEYCRIRCMHEEAQKISEEDDSWIEIER